MLSLPLRRRSISAKPLGAIIIIALTGGGLLSAYILQKPMQINPPSHVRAAATATMPNRDFGPPVRLKIPKLNIDARVDQMGLTSTGDMEAPTEAHTTGWFKLGTRPGNTGSAVIAGHFGLWKNGDTSVFDNLNKLKQGDTIYTEDNTGNIATFVVRESRTFGHNDNAATVFNTSDGKAHLNLITCQGVWHESQNTYSDRLVVFADKQPAIETP